MPRMEGFRVKNFKVLKDVTLGRLWNQRQIKPLDPMTAVIGKNGVGKSALFDAFGFLADALKTGVEEACDARGRGGFEKLRSQGQTGPIGFEVYYKEHVNTRPITYEIAIESDEDGRPYVLREIMEEDTGNSQPLSFLLLSRGKGVVWKGNQAGSQVNKTKEGFVLSEFATSLANSIMAEKKTATRRRDKTHRNRPLSTYRRTFFPFTSIDLVYPGDPPSNRLYLQAYIRINVPDDLRIKVNQTHHPQL